MTLTVGSLFSGIGGLDLGLERAGMRIVWQVEKDEFARNVLAKHWPEIKQQKDVTWAHVRAAIPKARCGACLDPVDLICGGFPCQDISVAGKRKGLAGERSGLWKEFARLIEELHPTWVVVENVAAGRSRWLGRILHDLAALWYCAEWRCLRASDFGAPHRRDRCFVIAYSERSSLRPQSRRGTGAFWDETVFAGLPGDPRVRPWTPARIAQPRVDRTGDGIPNRLDRLRCLGNAVVPQVAEFIGRRILAHAEART